VFNHASQQLDKVEVPVPNVVKFIFDGEEHSFPQSNWKFHTTVGWGLVKQQFKHLFELPCDRREYFKRRISIR
jgi:hypothetical protein